MKRYFYGAGRKALVLIVVLILLIQIISVDEFDVNKENSEKKVKQRSMASCFRRFGDSR